MSRGRLIVLGVLAVVLVAAPAFGADTTQDQPKPADKAKPVTVDLELKDVTVQQAIDKLFEGTGLKYTIKPGVSGRVVELRLKEISFAEALKSLADAAGFTYKLVDGVYDISPTGASALAATTAVQADSSTSATQDQGSSDTTQPADISANQDNVPVYYGQPYGSYAPGGAYPVPSRISIGSITIMPRSYYWPPVVVAGGSTIIRTQRPVPAPRLFVGPDVQRFFEGQNAIRSRMVAIPLY